MILPGGWIDPQGSIQRNFTFNPINGELELIIAQAGGDHKALAHQVTEILQAALASLGGSPPSWEVLQSLCIADRQFLMLQLAIRFAVYQRWYTAQCRQCKASFDYVVEYAQLPMQAADQSYPYAHAQISLGECKLRLPNGWDQAHLAGMDDLEEAIRYLAQACIMEIDGQDNFAPSKLQELTKEDVAIIDEVLDQVAPQFAHEIATQCPQCSYQQMILLDFYQGFSQTQQEVYAEVLQLAITCHWRERDILAMPRERRRRYLKVEI
ncbi:MAG: hypothetical protein V3T17_12950 [Pseudomonadales bacterium]